MKFKIGGVVALLLPIALYAGDPVIHKFEGWGKLSAGDKIIFYMGFTNGLVEGGIPHKLHDGADTRGHLLLDCLLDKNTNPTMPQAIAMIDKYYRDHPEKWSEMMGTAIFDAVMVKGGPCVADGK